MTKPKSAFNGLTHDELCAIGTRYCERVFRCPVAICEPRSLSPERPDVFAMRSGNQSILLEAKISRSDFLKDANKSFRVNPETGIGMLRYYIVPKGLLSLSDLPPKWGLIEVNHRGKAEFIHGQHPRKITDKKWVFETYNIENERLILFSYLRGSFNYIKKMRKDLEGV